MAARTQDGWTRIALLVWLGVLAGVGIHAYFFPRAHSLFDVYALASHNWWAGQDIYVLAREYYRYSPLFAIAVTPLAALPEAWGTALWKFLNGAVYGIALVVWARTVIPTRLGRTELAALTLLGLPLALHSLYNGQANLVMLGALLFGSAAAARDRWNTAAALIAIAVLVKGYPLAFALLLIWLYPRQFILRFLAASALGLLIPFATQPLGLVSAQYASWYHHLTASEHIMRERLRSINYLFALCHRPLAPRLFDLLEVIAGAVTLALCINQSRQTPERRSVLAWTFVWFATWAVLFGPATESCTYCLMAPAIAWALVEAYRGPTPWAGRALLVLCLLLMGVLSTDFFPPVVRNYVNEHAGQPFGALLFFVYLLRHSGGRAPAVQVDEPDPFETLPLTERAPA